MVLLGVSEPGSWEEQAASPATGLVLVCCLCGVQGPLSCVLQLVRDKASSLTFVLAGGHLLVPGSLASLDLK